ncbi:MAG: hypothetical protein JST85_20400 [Acidobacteria bacterium]|nr:hypothetical protein [Acidobacteriota bacterium]
MAKHFVLLERDPSEEASENEEPHLVATHSLLVGGIFRDVDRALAGAINRSPKFSLIKSKEFRDGKS